MSDAPVHGPDWPHAIQEIIGSTLDAIGRPALRDIYNATVGDRITAWRVSNLADVFRAYQEATRTLPPEGRRFVAEKVGIRLIEEASFEDEPDLQKIWGNLLAAAVSNKRPDVTSRYVSTARELTPLEVLFLKEVYIYCKGVDDRLRVPMEEPIRKPWKTLTPWTNFEQIEDILRHLDALGVVQRVDFRPHAYDPYEKRVTLRAQSADVRFTKFGWEFVCAAVEGAG